MKRKVFTLLLAFVSIIVSSQIIEPVKWEVSHEMKDDNVVEVTFIARMDTGWHLYSQFLDNSGPLPTTFNYDNLNKAVLKGETTSQSKVITEYDPNFETELSWYVHKAVFKQLFQVESDDYSISGNISYMACNDESCINPSPYEFSIGQVSKSETPVEAVSSDDAPLSTGIYAPVTDQFDNTGESSSSQTSFWTIFILGLLGGFIALFTPCVWPIIPMTVSFFLKRGDSTSKGKRDAILYGISIIVIYLVLGLLVTGIFGASALNSLSTNAGFNIFFFLLLVLFAVSFFGAFEIALPASWSSKIDAKAESTSGILSIMLMAFTLVLVSFSCTGPIIGTLLVQAASGSWLGPAIGMFGFALALALPFSLFATFPSMLKKVPRSGGWMNTLKVVLGFLELALSLKFLSVADLAYGWGILDRETFIVLWVIIFALLGLYLLGKIQLPHDDKIEKISVTRLFLAIVSLSYALYLVPGLWGAPLRSASAFAPPMSTQDFNLYEDEVHPDAHDFEIGFQIAKKENKPLLLDFSGFGCVNCRKMEASVWTDDNVSRLLKEDYVLVTLMVDDRTPLIKPITIRENGKEITLKTVGEKNSYIQRNKFGANAQPYYIILDVEGNALANPYTFDENPDNFVRYLESVK